MFGLNKDKIERLRMDDAHWKSLSDRYQKLFEESMQITKDLLAAYRTLNDQYNKLYNGVLETHNPHKSCETEMKDIWTDLS